MAPNAELAFLPGLSAHFCLAITSTEKSWMCASLINLIPCIRRFLSYM